MAIPTIPDLRTLMEAGVHFGHASGKWHPKMAPYIFGARDKLHLINLEKTREQLEAVLPVLEERVRSGKVVILVGTKKQVATQVGEVGERLGIPYVNVRWLGGTLTNFQEMQKSIARMKRLESFLASEESAQLIKKERVMQESELARMRAKFWGLRNLTKKPDALFIIDPAHEHNAVKEGRHENLELFALIDTNSDPSVLSHVIPANDDGAKALKLILGLIEETIANGQKVISVGAEKDGAEKDAKEAGAEKTEKESPEKVETDAAVVTEAPVATEAALPEEIEVVAEAIEEAVKVEETVAKKKGKDEKKEVVKEEVDDSTKKDEKREAKAEKAEKAASEV